MTTNSDLLKAIRVLAISDNSKTRQTLYEALLTSTLILPTHTPSDGSQAALIQAYTPQGQPYILAFTDEDALTRWQESSPFITLSARDLFPILAQQHAPMLMLNIAGPIGGEITAYEIATLAQGIIPNTPESVEGVHLQQPTQVSIAPLPDKPPAHTVANLQRVAGSLPQIEALYLFMMGFSPDEMNLTVGVRLTPNLDSATTDQAMRTLASGGIHHSLVEGDIQYLVLDGDLWAHVTANFPPVYRK